MMLFPGYLTKACKKYINKGGQALEQWDKGYTMLGNAPRCFVGKDFVKLYDQNKGRLVRTAKELGVRVVVVDREGEQWQHVDLVGRPMQKALARAQVYKPKKGK